MSKSLIQVHRKHNQDLFPNTETSRPDFKRMIRHEKSTCIDLYSNFGCLRRWGAVVEIPLHLHNLRLTQVQATHQRRRSLQLPHQRQLLQNLRRVKRLLLLKLLLLRRFLPLHSKQLAVTALPSIIAISNTSALTEWISI